MKWKKWLTAVAAVGTLALAGCSSSGSGSGGPTASSSSGDKSPLTIAIIPPSTGALAVFGTADYNGWKYAADEANAKGGVDGHKVVLVKSDTDGTAAATLRAAKQAVAQQGAHFIGGIVTTPENVALNAQLANLNAISLDSLSQDDSLAGSDCVANAFHISQTAGMLIAATADAIAKIPGTKYAIQAEDYATGHTAAKAFQAGLAKAGKTVVSTQFAPLGTTDFGTYLSKIQNSGADALILGEYGADGVAFVNQMAQFGLSKQLKGTLGLNTVSEPLFPTLGNKILGFYDTVQYNVDDTSALNQSFVAGYTKAYGSKPYYIPALSYEAAEALFAAVTKAHSVDPAKVRDALSNLTWPSIQGTVSMRAADHQLLIPSFVGQVVSAGGSNLKFKIIKSSPASVTTPTANPDCKIS